MLRAEPRVLARRTAHGIEATEFVVEGPARLDAHEHDRASLSVLFLGEMGVVPSILSALLICAPTATPPSTMSPETAEVLNVLTRFEEVWNRGDVDGVIDAYLDPHVDANAPDPVMSRQETREFLGRFLAERPSRIHIESDEIVIEGDVAFQRGTLFLYPLVAGGEEAREAVVKRYLEILRRDADGAWRVFWSMDGPIAE